MAYRRVVAGGMNAASTLRLSSAGGTPSRRRSPNTYAGDSLLDAVDRLIRAEPQHDGLFGATWLSNTVRPPGREINSSIVTVSPLKRPPASVAGGATRLLFASEPSYFREQSRVD